MTRTDTRSSIVLIACIGNNVSWWAIKTPIRVPRANVYCDRLVATLQRECLDYFIPIRERVWSKFFIRLWHSTWLDL